MEEPPILLDGARVLRFAILGDAARSGRRYSVLADGIPLGPESVSRLVMAEDMIDGGVFVIYCSTEWSTVTAVHCADLETAQKAAEASCVDVAPKWITFRELSPEEQREVETTRSFLRELAADNR